MPWSDELEHLTTYVIDTFGYEQLWAALGRAQSTAMNRAESVADLDAMRYLVSSDGRAVSLDLFYDALLIELRRLGRPQ